MPTLMQGGPSISWGYNYVGFREFGGPRGWLAGLEGGNIRYKRVKGETMGKSAKEANVDTLGECIYSKR